MRQPVWVLQSETFPHFPNEGGTLATVSTNRMLRYWDVATQTLQRVVPLPGITGSTQQCLFALRGNRLASLHADAMIKLHDTTTGGLIRKFKSHAGGIAWPYTEGVRFSPDARLLATAGADDGVKL